MNKNLYLKTVYLALAVLLLLNPRKEAVNTIEFNEFPEECLHNTRVHLSNEGTKEYTIADLTYARNINPVITDCVLSFNKKSGDLWKDDSKKYSILKANYEFVSPSGSLGKGCASFYKRDHAVMLNSSRNLWLGSRNDLGSFSIEMRFMSRSLQKSGVLFSRIGYFSGTKKGITIVLNNGRVEGHFYNIFEKDGDRWYTVYLNRGRRIKQNSWYHVLISFDRMSGKISKYLNGEEEDTAYVTDDDEPYNNVYLPSFGSRDKAGNLTSIDAPPAVLGKDFIGYIDEFRISYTTYENLREKTAIAVKNYEDMSLLDRTPYNIEGIISSPVYSFKSTGTMVKELSWTEKLKKDTFIWLEFRISDHLFTPGNSELKWYRITNKQKNIFLKKDTAGGFLRGKYYQWRAHLVASPDGKNSPSLSSITMTYILDRSPNPPRFLEVTGMGDRFITLRWLKNVDADIQGYRIYYGIKEGRFDGIISQIKGNPITNKTSKGDYIELTLTNDILEENRKLDRRGLLSFPRLKNTVLYFFAVTAYDSYKPDTPFNHESKLSKSITARPFAGSEID